MRVTVMVPSRTSSQVGLWSCAGLQCCAVLPSSGLCLSHCLLLLPVFVSFFLSVCHVSVLKTVPFTARTGKRTSRLLCEASLGEELPL